MSANAPSTRPPLSWIARWIVLEVGGSSVSPQASRCSSSACRNSSGFVSRRKAKSWGPPGATGAAIAGRDWCGVLKARRPAAVLAETELRTLVEIPLLVGRGQVQEQLLDLVEVPQELRLALGLH